MAKLEDIGGGRRGPLRCPPENGWPVAADCPDPEIIAGHDEPTLARGLAEAEAIMASKFPIETLARAWRLRSIQLTGAGVDHLVPARSSSTTSPAAARAIRSRNVVDLAPGY